jgi:hypothetical protein
MPVAVLYRAAGFRSKQYRADVVGSTACAASQKSTAPSNANRLGWHSSELPLPPIWSRASQNAAAILFDLGDVDIR